MAAPSPQLRGTPLEETRERRRRPPFNLRELDKRNEVAERVVRMYRRDLDARDKGRQARLQRYAKYRQWTEGQTLPWDDASDVAIPDMMSMSQSTQDAMFNAVVATRPAIHSNAQREDDRERERNVDLVLDTQVFEENNGERIHAEAIDYYVNEGVATIYIPWVKEMRRTRELRIFDPIPPDRFTREYLLSILRGQYAPARWRHFEAGEQQGWDWRVEPTDENREGTAKRVAFYTRDDRMVEMVIDHDVKAFDGPRPTPLGYDQVVCPIDVANLQPPGRSNPGGAPHVTVVEPITVAEVAQARRDGFFDLVTDDQMESMRHRREQRSDDDESHEQKRDMAGGEEGAQQEDPLHRTLTLLRCFDVFSPGEGEPAVDMIWWVVLETKTLCKAARLTELYPFKRRVRPFAEAPFIPVPQLRDGISMLELIEGLHDLRKQTLDMGIDGQSLAVFPFGFYRPSSSINPQPIKIWPGEMQPVSDPQRDVAFPTINANGDAWTLNLFGLVGSLEEQVTLIGDVQRGRVPAGRSSALRTSGGIAQLLAQGEARPERTLRRYFAMWVDAYEIMHWMNQSFLTEAKQVAIEGVTKPEERSYATIDRNALKGDFRFRFDANVGNASRAAFQESLTTLLGIYVNDLTISLGIVTPENLYQMLRDLGRAVGPDTTRYLTPPSPTSSQFRITAQEALTAVIDNQAPAGVPFEPAEEHLQTLIEFTRSDDFGLLSPEQQAVLQGYMENVRELALAQQQAQQNAQAAGQFAQRLQPQGTPGPDAGPPGPPQQRFSANELADETLPTAGGGGS